MEVSTLFPRLHLSPFFSPTQLLLACVMLFLAGGFPLNLFLFPQLLCSLLWGDFVFGADLEARIQNEKGKLPGLSLVQAPMTPSPPLSPSGSEGPERLSYTQHLTDSLPPVVVVIVYFYFLQNRRKE